MSDTKDGGNENCPNCGGPIVIRNPTGKCDHLYYPENVPGYVSERSALLRCEEALRAAKTLCDNINEFGHVTDQIIHDAAEVQIRAALTLLDEVRK